MSISRCNRVALVLSVLFCATVVVLGAPQQPTKEPVPIISQESDIQPDGTFKWSFESGDGTKAEQSGQPKQVLFCRLLILKKC